MKFERIKVQITYDVDEEFGLIKKGKYIWTLEAGAGNYWRHENSDTPVDLPTLNAIETFLINQKRPERPD